MAKVLILQGRWVYKEKIRGKCVSEGNYNISRGRSGIFNNQVTYYPILS